MYLSGFFKNSLEVKGVLLTRKEMGKVGQDRSGRGREFQMHGASNEKERRPSAVCRPNIRDCKEGFVKGS